MSGTVRPDEWHGDKWSHESIMDMQARMAPAGITRIAEEWKSTLGELDSLFAIFLDDVTAMIDESWSGPGAQAALGTMRAYVENSGVALRRAFTLSTGLEVLAGATSELQQKIASPSAHAPVGRMGVDLGWATPVAENLDLWEQALAQVRTMYSGPAVQAGNAVAELIGPQERLRFGSGADADAVPNRAADEQAERAGEFLARWGPELNPQQTVPPANTGMPLQIPLTVAGISGNPFRGRDFGLGSPTGSEADELGEDDVYAGQNWMRDPLWRENPTRSAGFESATPTGRQPLSPDRMPSLGSGPTVANAGGFGAGATTRAWGPMMPMMGTYPAHANQRRGDENEHYSPKYLVNSDNTRELLGELPKGSAPVIGLWEGEGTDDDFGPPPRHGFRSR
ncbi:hypothetical protein [Mycobacteroides salmoniphilum]|uniref:hypothetical protein n=1 Tax=Mycobacteroides salmoniphilum TaxID=404941 RepID=UPI001066CFBB|nr:hypothetical protein [Mycobacteroides salmoniphilum]TDZ81937.1 hypothetical protein DE4586_01898 [Mycobacteroides salmoniphilum]TDZ89437.1 hypothetical protein DE4587_01814 [Mycobacteroides salmoniphilum]